MTGALYSLIRPHYQSLQGYVSAGMESEKSAEKVFMNANENPFALPGLEGLNRYPQPQPKALREGYAKLYGVKPDYIAMTRGADEAIVLLVNVFCEPHKDAIVITPPTFGMYGRSAGALPAKMIEAPLLKKDGAFALDVDAVIAAAKKPEAKLVFLCSPGNPTSGSIPHADIRRVCHETEGHAAVVLDETYAEFSTEGSLAGELSKIPNLIILRTLSKSYALAGARMGAMLCADTGVVDVVVKKAMDAYPLPVPSIDAAMKIVSDAGIQKQAQENIKTLLVERDRLRTAFSASPAVRHVYPSDANFILVEMERAKDFIAHCAAANVIIRDFSDKKGTENCVRISPGLPEQNDLLINLLKKF